MKRIIKFRAWDIPRGVMVYPDTYCCDMTVTFDGRVFCHDSYYGIHDRHFILMLFTGLKDDNDRDIYEGDIVQWKYGDGATFEATVVWGDHTIEGDLDLDRRIIGFFLQYDDGGITDISRDQYKVIGNIHENPDLLKTIKVAKYV